MILALSLLTSVVYAHVEEKECSLKDNIRIQNTESLILILN